MKVKNGTKDRKNSSFLVDRKNKDFSPNKKGD